MIKYNIVNKSGKEITIPAFALRVWKSQSW